MRYDLHIHTNASDGLEPPEELILHAVEAGLAGLAITDHDTLAALAPARQFIRTHHIPIEFIPGIEINTDYGAEEVHILGYYIDFNNGRLADRLGEIRTMRYQRAEQIVAKLQAMGIAIRFDQVQALAEGGLIGRPHIARALCNAGYVQSEEEAFQKYIERGRPAYVPRYKFTPAEAISLIHQAGGIAVLAHPGLIKDTTIIYEVIQMSVDGLEIYYPEHSPDQIKDLLDLADEYHLLKTGGSDYHGPGSTANRSCLGSAGIDQTLMAEFRAYHQQKIIK